MHRHAQTRTAAWADARGRGGRTPKMPPHARGTRARRAGHGRTSSASSGHSSRVRWLGQAERSRGSPSSNPRSTPKTRNRSSGVRQTMAECHACHKLAEKTCYLRPRIPEAPATRIIDMKPGANCAWACAQTPPMKNAAAAGTIRLGDLTVNRLGFGAMRVCGPQVWGEPQDRAGAPRCCDAPTSSATISSTPRTATDRTSPRPLIAEALHPYPADLVIATKGGLVRPRPHAWDENGHARASAARARRQPEAAAARTHRPVPVPRARSQGAFRRIDGHARRAAARRQDPPSRRLQRDGRATRSGAPHRAHRFGAERIQPRNRVERRRACRMRAAGIAFMPWYPLGGRPRHRTSRMKRIAARHRVSTCAVALAWLLARSPVMLPIPGTESVEHLEDNCARQH